MYIPNTWLILGIIFIFYLFWTHYREHKKRRQEEIWFLMARDEWLSLRMEYLSDTKGFIEVYTNQLPDEYDYYYVHKYYRENPEENFIEDIKEEHFPDFDFSI